MSIMNRSSTREVQVHTEAVEGFPARIRSLLLEVADRRGTATHGPWEDGSGEPLQSDAEAALRWIELHAADTGGGCRAYRAAHPRIGTAGRAGCWA